MKTNLGTIVNYISDNLVNSLEIAGQNALNFVVDNSAKVFTTTMALIFAGIIYSATEAEPFIPVLDNYTVPNLRDLIVGETIDGSYEIMTVDSTHVTLLSPDASDDPTSLAVSERTTLSNLADLYFGNRSFNLEADMEGIKAFYALLLTDNGYLADSLTTLDTIKDALVIKNSDNSAGGDDVISVAVLSGAKGLFRPEYVKAVPVILDGESANHLYVPDNGLLNVSLDVISADFVDQYALRATTGIDSIIVPTDGLIPGVNVNSLKDAHTYIKEKLESEDARTDSLVTAGVKEKKSLTEIGTRIDPITAAEENSNDIKYQQEALEKAKKQFDKNTKEAIKRLEKVRKNLLGEDSIQSSSIRTRSTSYDSHNSINLAVGGYVRNVEQGVVENLSDKNFNLYGPQLAVRFLHPVSDKFSVGGVAKITAPASDSRTSISEKIDSDGLYGSDYRADTINEKLSVSPGLTVGPMLYLNPEGVLSIGVFLGAKGEQFTGTQDGKTKYCDSDDNEVYLINIPSNESTNCEINFAYGVNANIKLSEMVAVQFTYDATSDSQKAGVNVGVDLK